MRTLTVKDLPSDLVWKLKLRSVQERKTMKVLMREILEKAVEEVSQ